LLLRLSSNWIIRSRI